jgi:hypothetical protein
MAQATKAVKHPSNAASAWLFPYVRKERQSLQSNVQRGIILQGCDNCFSSVVPRRTRIVLVNLCATLKNKEVIAKLANL